MVPGLGACNASAQVSTSTPQDTFVLAVATPSSPTCAGQSAAGSMHAEAATRSIDQAPLPMTAMVEMTLFAPQLNTGSIDFYNTAVAPPPRFGQVDTHELDAC